MDNHQSVWSQQEQSLLDQALQKYPKDSYINSKDRWRDISSMTGRSARECLLRYQYIRNELKSKTESKDQTSHQSDEIKTEVKSEAKTVKTIVNTEVKIESVKPISTVTSLDEKTKSPASSLSASVKNDSNKESKPLTLNNNDINKIDEKLNKKKENSKMKDDMKKKEEGEEEETPQSSIQTQSVSEKKAKKDTSSIPCRFFKSNGACRYGQKCQYSHDVPVPTTSSSDTTSSLPQTNNEKTNNKNEKKQKKQLNELSNELKENNKDIKSNNNNNDNKGKKNKKKKDQQQKSNIGSENTRKAAAEENEKEDPSSTLEKKNDESNHQLNESNKKNKSKKGKTNKKNDNAKDNSNDHTNDDHSNTQVSKVVLCSYFSAPNGCAKGERCKFAHVTAKPSNNNDTDEPKQEVVVKEEENTHLNEKNNKNENNKKNKKNKKENKKKTQWWQELEEMDPISLEPIADLRYPPFELRHAMGDTAARGNLYDGRLLALYFVASGIFEDPMNRRELTLEECVELDDYLKKNRLGPPWPQVASAFKLKSEQKATELAAMAGAMPRSHGRSSNEARASVLQREAAGLLLSMFGISVAQDGSTAGRDNHRRQGRRGQEPRHGSGGGGGGGGGPREEQHMMGGAGHAMIDDDLTPSVPTQPAPGQQFLEAAASSFPCLPETANKVVPMPWVKVKPTPPPVSKPTRVVGQDGVSEGVLMRNIRMKEALGLSETSAGGGGGGGVSGSSGGASSSSLLEAAAKERLACVWPPILRKWYSEIPSEVIKIERKLKDLINDPKGTSISLKPMNREDRRLCHLLGEFYLLNTRSDDNNDGHGLKCMTFILTNNSQIPLPLLSEALIFERKYPDLIAKSLKYQADLEFEKQKEIDYRGYQGGNNETHCSNCLLLKNVPDLISLKEIRQLILLFVELGQVIDLFQVDLPGHHNNMGMDDHGLEYCVVFKTNEIAEHVFKTSSCNSVKLPFTIHRYPLMQLTDKQPSLPIHHKPDLFDSWNDNDNSDQNNMNQNDTENETSTKIDDEILLQQSNDMKQNEKESTHGAAEDISTSPLLQMGEVASDWEALADTCEAPVAE